MLTFQIIICKGTRMFLKDVSFSVITPNLLFNESDYNKEIIQRAFLDGFNRDVIKSIQCCTSFSQFHSHNIFEILKYLDHNNFLVFHCIKSYNNM